MEVGSRLNYSVAAGDRTEKLLKVQQHNLRLDIGKNYFTIKVVKH